MKKNFIKKSNYFAIKINNCNKYIFLLNDLCLYQKNLFSEKENK